MGKEQFAGRKKLEILDELKTALENVHEKHHEEVSKSLTHDISMIARTIDMVENRSA